MIAAVALTALAAGALALAFRPQEADPVAARFRRYAGATPAAAAVAGPATRKRPPRLVEAWAQELGFADAPVGAAIALGVPPLLGLALGTLAGLAPLGLVAGVIAVVLRLRMARAKRFERLAEQLPDALMTMATAVRGGLGFQQALQLAAREGPQPLAGELGRLERDLAMGLEAEEALERLGKRLGSADGEMLIAALLIQRQTGGNLSETLANLHTTIRDRQAVFGQLRTLTAQGKLSALVLGALPFVLGFALLMINPTYLSALWLDPRGQLIAGVSAALMLLGIYFITKVVKVEF